MVAAAVHFDELGFEVSADLGENSVQPSDGIGVDIGRYFVTKTKEGRRSADKRIAERGGSCSASPGRSEILKPDGNGTQDRMGQPEELGG